MDEQANISLTMRFERYLSEEMTAEEKQQFELDCEQNPQIRQAYEDHLVGKWALFQEGYEQEKEDLRKHFEKIDPGPPVQSLARRPILIAAACIAFLLLVYGIWQFNATPISPEQLFSEAYEMPRIPETMGSNTEQNLQNAYQLLKKDSIQAALVQFERVLTDSLYEPTSELYFYQGIALMGDNQFSAARTSFSKANMHEEQAEWYSAMSWLKEGNVNQATLALKKIAAASEHFYKQQANTLLKKM